MASRPSAECPQESSWRAGSGSPCCRMAARPIPATPPVRRPGPAARPGPSAAVPPVPSWSADPGPTGTPSRMTSRAKARRFAPLPIHSHGRRPAGFSPTGASRSSWRCRRSHNAGTARRFLRCRPGAVHGRPEPRSPRPAPPRPAAAAAVRPATPTGAAPAGRLPPDPVCRWDPAPFPLTAAERTGGRSRRRA